MSMVSINGTPLNHTYHTIPMNVHKSLGSTPIVLRISDPNSMLDTNDIIISQSYVIHPYYQQILRCGDAEPLGFGYGLGHL